VAQQPIIGTITGVFDGALDGLAARLVRRRKFGYTVELLESRQRYQVGDIVYLSFAEFRIQPARTDDVPLRPAAPAEPV
jgi:hypothetical protein